MTLFVTGEKCDILVEEMELAGWVVTCVGVGQPFPLTLLVI